MIKPWVKAPCTQCGTEEEYITRTQPEPESAYDTFLCQSCEMYNKGYQDSLKEKVKLKLKTNKHVVSKCSKCPFHYTTTSGVLGSRERYLEHACSVKIWVISDLDLDGFPKWCPLLESNITVEKEN